MKNQPAAPLPPLYLPLFLISIATLTFEITLTRIFSVAQFYHFAFMIVSIALLGFGASGTALTIFPRLGRRNPRYSVGMLGLGAGLSILLAYILTNILPFDSFSIAWDRTQVWILVAHYIALATPFLFTGMVIGLMLEEFPETVGRTYAINLLGSALGCVVALASPLMFGAEGTVSLSAGLAGLGGLISLKQGSRFEPGPAAVTVLLLLTITLDLVLRLLSGAGFPFMKLHHSPYKGFSYAMQYPNADLVFSRWNGFSRVDVVRSGGIHSIPGLSYRYLDPLPPQDGLLVDGGDLSAVLLVDADLSFSNFLPQAVAYPLRPGAKALILEPRGGLNVLAAIALGAENITAVEANPLITRAASHIYTHPDVTLVHEAERTFLEREREQKFDVIILSLTSSYHPIRSGAYSLAEDYRYTVESFEAALSRLKPFGLLVVTRWLQDPPSESLRTAAIAVTSLENRGEDPSSHMVAFRGYNTITLLVKNQAFTGEELAIVRNFTSERAFDLVYAPGLEASDTNQYNILPDPIYYQGFTDLIDKDSREQFYEAYAYDIRPPTDDHPFFGHFFKWSQTDQILAEFGHTWQPFGGAGYFVILALLVLAVFAAVLLIIFPLAFRRPDRGNTDSHPVSMLRPLLYFGFIGLAFLLVEIPLLQRYILYLGNPAYALTTVLFSILLFSAIGSRLNHILPHKLALLVLIILSFVYPTTLPSMIANTLGLPFYLRVLLTMVSLAPLGFLMGIPFPAGIRWMEGGIKTVGPVSTHPKIPWVWATNGAASVVASVLAALLAMTYGFNWVLRLGSILYVAALITVLRPLRSPRR